MIFTGGLEQFPKLKRFDGHYSNAIGSLNWHLNSIDKDIQFAIRDTQLAIQSYYSNIIEKKIDRNIKKLDVKQLQSDKIKGAQRILITALKRRDKYENFIEKKMENHLNKTNLLNPKEIEECEYFLNKVRELEEKIWAKNGLILGLSLSHEEELFKEYTPIKEETEKFKEKTEKLNTNVRSTTESQTKQNSNNSDSGSSVSTQQIMFCTVHPDDHYDD